MRRAKSQGNAINVQVREVSQVCIALHLLIVDLSGFASVLPFASAFPQYRGAVSSAAVPDAYLGFNNFRDCPSIFAPRWDLANRVQKEGCTGAA